MKQLIDRYLDGTLSDEEAEAFLAGLDQDPELATELYAYESMLAKAAQPVVVATSADFTDSVMHRVHGLERSSSRTPARGLTPWSGSRLAWAAGLILIFGMGFVTARLGLGNLFRGPEMGDADLANSSFVTADVAPATGDPQQLRLVRLVYVPQETGVNQVTVAGTFNGWNPEQTHLQKNGSSWTALLVLPPGTYEYMFVENGQNWVEDPLALQTRDDGFGRQNAVLDLSI